MNIFPFKKFLTQLTAVIFLSLTILNSSTQPVSAIDTMTCTLNPRHFVVTSNGDVNVEFFINNVDPDASGYNLYITTGGKRLLASSYRFLTTGDDQGYAQFTIPQSTASSFFTPLHDQLIWFQIHEINASGQQTNRDCAKDPGSFMSLKMTSDLVDLINNNTGEPPPGACPNCTPPQICSLIQVGDPDNPDSWECEFFNDDEDTGSVVDPTEGCPDTDGDDKPDGINTALGCIPFKTDAFVPALLSFIMGIAGIIALVIMIIGSVTVMTGGGNPEQVKKGKELFTGAVIGILFMIFSVVILRIIAGDIIGLPGFTR